MEAMGKGLRLKAQGVRPKDGSYGKRFTAKGSWRTVQGWKLNGKWTHEIILTSN